MFEMGSCYGYCDGVCGVRDGYGCVDRGGGSGDRGEGTRARKDMTSRKGKMRIEEEVEEVKYMDGSAVG